MIGWALNLLYVGLLLAVSPLLVFRAVRLGKYRAGWSEKFLGRCAVRAGVGPAIWLHAVSVGEVLILRTIIPQLRQQIPGCEIWISTTTHTGHAVACEKYPDCRVIYFPLDFTWAVRTAMARVRPSCIVLVELELWPNFIREAARCGVPLVLINGRMSERSYRGYRRIRWLMQSLWTAFHKIGVQTDEYRRRLEDLGAPVDRLTVTGSTKFDGLETDRQNERTQEIRRGFGLRDDEVVIMAGSTQAPEEELALMTWQALKPRHPELRLVLVPRHQERFEEVAQLVRSQGLPLLRRSEIKSGRASMNSDAVLLLDTLGELGAAWGLADIAFVGGSLTRRGGQNMIEPAAYAAAVLFGPNTQNFRQIVELLLSEGAARVVLSGEDLTRQVSALLAHPDQAEELGATAQRLVQKQQGATLRSVELIAATLKSSGKLPDR